MNRAQLLLEAKESIEQFIRTHPDGVVCIRGATATGKSRLAVELSEFFELEVISADSRQIYKEMNIGTDKVSSEIRNKIPHHLIDIVNPDTRYTAAQWQDEALTLVPQIRSRNRIPCIVGGTGLYIDTIYKNFSIPHVEPRFDLRDERYALESAKPGSLHSLLETLDPEEAKNIHPHSTRYLVRALEIVTVLGKPKSQLAVQKPVPRPLLMIGLRRSKETTNTLIDRRVEQMVSEGLLEEVKNLLQKGYTTNDPGMKSIGYCESIEFLEGNLTQEERKEQIKIHTHRYAKRQRTWFRRYMADAQHTPKEFVTYNIFNVEEL